MVYRETLTVHRVLSFRRSVHYIYNWFYFVPRLKNLREVKRAESYLLSLVVKAFSNPNSFFFSFLLAQKSARGNTDFYRDSPLPGGYSGQLLYKVVKCFSPLMRPTGNENSEYFDCKNSKCNHFQIAILSNCFSKW